jgi:hypothetical protein
MMKPLFALSLVFILPACTQGMAADAPEARSTADARAMDRMEDLLGGKTPGPPQSCITRFEAERMSAVDNNTILFRARSNLVYRNTPQGDCPIEGSSRRLEHSTISTNLCRGEQLNVVDNQTGAYFGTCILGDFVPYRR